MNTIASWVGIIVIGIIAAFFPRIILAIVAWNTIDFGFGGGIILAILTILAVIVDFTALLE